MIKKVQNSLVLRFILIYNFLKLILLIILARLELKTSLTFTSI